MCFNPEVSITTYIVGIIGCILLILNNDVNFIPQAIFFIWVIHMQLIEFFLWKNQPCNQMNKNISIIGMIINNMEPIILWLAIIIFSDKKLPTWIHLIMALYLIASFYISYKSYTDNKTSCTTVTPESSPHLNWKWNEGNIFTNIFYIFFLLVCVLLSIYGLSYGMVMAFIFLLSFFASFLIYGKSHSVGAMWCFIAAFVPIVLPFICKIPILQNLK